MTLNLDVPASAWEAIGDEGQEGGVWARVVTQITINGVQFHLEGWQIEEPSYGDGTAYLQAALQQDDSLAQLADAVAADGPFTTVSVNGRSYVLVASPYC
ncbi:hypothetical protein [Streptacidiphilus jiangxiensis]|uniref:Uncharacterized protein n=1 Tax=Streptacidiphilus jiangxiensis TaxID=235985 RepID=A0A1H8B899_STRJI|nr:hypothetical protein [Streptacidiphilus jiangxiensis]SEM79165.1 hypothetical protein SAMN05414137_15914 [Streptacidiphilus jiangxiensis]